MAARKAVRSTGTVGPSHFPARRSGEGFACYQFATLGVIEAIVESDDEKNRLWPPIAYCDATTDYLAAFVAALTNQRTREGQPALASWAMTTRLNPLGALPVHQDDPLVIDARERIKRYAPAAASNLARLLGASIASSATTQGLAWPPASSESEPSIRPKRCIRLSRSCG